MEHFKQLAKCGILCGLLAIIGCSEKDTEKIGKVGGKAMDKANTVTNEAGEKLGMSLKGVQGNLDELEVSARVYTRLKWDQVLEGKAIKVQADQGIVTLTGSVRNEIEHRRALELAESTTGVEQVIDALDVTSK